MNKGIAILVVIMLLILKTGFSLSPVPSFQIALLKYNGGGDWYANPTSLPPTIPFFLSFSFMISWLSSLKYMQCPAFFASLWTCSCFIF